MEKRGRSGGIKEMASAGLWLDVAEFKCTWVFGSWFLTVTRLCESERALYQLFVTALYFLWMKQVELWQTGSVFYKSVWDATGIKCFPSVIFRRRGFSWGRPEGNLHLWYLSVWGRVRRWLRGCLVSVHNIDCIQRWTTWELSKKTESRLPPGGWLQCRS